MRIIVLALVLLLAGCATSGTKMDAASLERLEPGTTTQAEMVSMFGPPISQGYGPDGVMSMTWHYVHVGPFGSNMQQQNLIAQFDADGNLLRYNLLDNPSGVRFGY